MSKRLAGRFGYPEAPDNFKPTLHPDKLDQPLKWKKPRMIFVCSMGDLFHEIVSDDTISAIWHRMIAADQHTFQVLTKRPKRMAELIPKLFNDFFTGDHYTPPNIWLGVTAENQEAADERIPWLLKTPAAVRFVSVEPMLGPVDLQKYLRHDPVLCGCESNASLCPYRNQRIDWAICGGETGPGARPMKAGWALDLARNCQEAGVPFFFKKWGSAFEGDPDAVKMRREWPK
jgi:protein gp37